MFERLKGILIPDTEKKTMPQSLGQEAYSLQTFSHTADNGDMDSDIDPDENTIKPSEENFSGDPIDDEINDEKYEKNSSSPSFGSSYIPGFHGFREHSDNSPHKNFDGAANKWQQLNDIDAATTGKTSVSSHTSYKTSSAIQIPDSWPKKEKKLSPQHNPHKATDFSFSFYHDQKKALAKKAMQHETHIALQQTAPKLKTSGT